MIFLISDPLTLRHFFTALHPGHHRVGLVGLSAPNKPDF